MDRPTREQRIAEIKKDLAEQTAGKCNVIELNILDIESLVDHTIRMEDLMYEFKQSIIPAVTQAEGLTRLSTDAIGTSHQLAHMVTILLKCIPELDRFDECMASFIPAMATLAAIMDKQKELAELSEATK